MDSTNGPRTAPRSMRALVPTSPEDASALYTLLRDDMARHVVGHEEGINRLAVLGVRHLGRDLSHDAPFLRALLLGPSGVGKRTLALALAEAVGLPWVYLPASAMSELNWHGTDVADYLTALYDRVPGSDYGRDQLALVERAVVIIDDIDQLRLPGRYGSASTLDYQLGRQRSLALLVGDSVVPLNQRDRHTRYWPSREALVICCAELAGMRSDNPGVEDLVDWGLTPELARPLGRATVLRLSPLQPPDMVRLLRTRTSELIQAYHIFGYELVISDEAFRYVAENAPEDTGVEGAIGLLATTAHLALTRLIAESAPMGSRYVLAPDDIRIPHARGMWRE